MNPPNLTTSTLTSEQSSEQSPFLQTLSPHSLSHLEALNGVVYHSLPDFPEPFSFKSSESHRVNSMSELRETELLREMVQRIHEGPLLGFFQMLSNEKLKKDLKEVLLLQDEILSRNHHLINGEFRESSGRRDKSREPEVFSSINEALKAFAGLLNDQETSDAVIRIDEERFYVHSQVLASRSRVLGEKFSHSVDSCVEVTECSAHTFREILAYIYQGQIHLDERNVIDIYLAASHFELGSLQKRCLEFHENMVSLENALTWLKETYNYGDRMLYRQVLAFVLANARLVLRSGEFETLPRELFIEILKSNELDMPEIRVIKLAAKWLNKQEKDLNLLQEVKRSLRFTLLNEEALKYVAQTQVWEKNLLSRREQKECWENRERRLKGDQINGRVDSDENPRNVVMPWLFTKWEMDYRVHEKKAPPVVRGYWFFEVNKSETTPSFKTDHINWRLKSVYHAEELGHHYGMFLGLDEVNDHEGLMAQDLKIKHEIVFVHQRDLRKTISFKGETWLSSFNKGKNHRGHWFSEGEIKSFKEEGRILENGKMLVQARVALLK